MSALRQTRTFTFDEYLMIERSAPYKSEYLDGYIFAMSGGTLNHSIIAANFLTDLSQKLRGSGCRAVGSDMRIAAEDLSFSAYPDVTVYCGDPQFYGDRMDVLLNPRLIVEVLSPSTRSYDRGDKFERYRQIASLIDYLLVDPDAPHVELWHRNEEGWASTSATAPDAALFLPSLNVQLQLAALYEGVF